MAITNFADEPFPEEGTRGVQMTFRDEDGNLIAPVTLFWTLTNRPGIGVDPTVINSREQIEIPSPSSVETIVLSGDDLAYLPAEVNGSVAKRMITVEFTYNSALGADLPETVQYGFSVENFRYIE
jgi:hypothetical protein